MIKDKSEYTRELLKTKTRNSKPYLTQYQQYNIIMLKGGIK